MKFFTNILTLLLVFTLIAGSSGVSYFLHNCSHSHKTNVSLYADVFTKKSSCCGDKKVITSNTENNQNCIDKPSCCKNTYFFFKLPVTPIQNLLVLIENVTDFFLSTNDETILLNLKQTICNIVLSHSPPLLFSGKQYLHFIHSIKIPSPVL